MTYSTFAVVSFAQKVAARFGVNPGLDKPYSKWVDFKKNLDSLRVKAHLNGVSYALFLMTIAQAKNHLDQKDKDSFFSKTRNSTERNRYLDNFIDWSIQHFNQLKSQSPLLLVNITPPLKLGSAVSPRTQINLEQLPVVKDGPDLLDRFLLGVDKKITKMVRDKQVDSFVGSEAFKRLKKYQNEVLSIDIRSHSYLCGLLEFRVDKASVLKEFIDGLETATSMLEIRKKIHQFYIGRDSLTYNNPTPYQILNTGQNITTRFFSILGMRTTTISLIDELVTSMNPTASLSFHV